MLVVGCKSESTKKTPEQLFDECASGVVLILLRVLSLYNSTNWTNNVYDGT
jgi:hypothetical protein